jgi:hypothetical protein
VPIIVQDYQQAVRSPSVKGPMSMAHQEWWCLWRGLVGTRKNARCHVSSLLLYLSLLAASFLLLLLLLLSSLLSLSLSCVLRVSPPCRCFIMPAGGRIPTRAVWNQFRKMQKLHRAQTYARASGIVPTWFKAMLYSPPPPRMNSSSSRSYCCSATAVALVYWLC